MLLTHIATECAFSDASPNICDFMTALVVGSLLAVCMSDTMIRQIFAHVRIISASQSSVIMAYNRILFSAVSLCVYKG